MSCGIMVGSDKRQQDLLPFWWINLRLHNNIPVTFCDFGMDEAHLDWCRERGDVISLEKEITTPSEAKAWFKKPLAISLSSYDKTLWMDVDCLIRGSISPIFDYCRSDVGIAMVKEPNNVISQWRKAGFITENTIMYNSGVVAVKKGCAILQIWKEACINFKGYRGDQEILADLLHIMQITPDLIPEEYNWLINGHRNLNRDTHVLHMTGNKLKSYLKIIHNQLINHQLGF